MLKTFISQLVSELQMDKGIVKIDSSGGYQLSFNRDYAVKITETPQGIVFNCSMIKLTSSPKEEALLEYAMNANLFGRGTNEGVLGLNPDGDVLMLTQSVESFNQFKDFKLCLENFLNQVDYWREVAIKQ